MGKNLGGVSLIPCRLWLASSFVCYIAVMGVDIRTSLGWLTKFLGPVVIQSEIFGGLKAKQVCV